jgi:hypothetical protein
MAFFKESQMERYNKKFNNMLDELKEISKSNNTFTINEFKKYEILFQKSDYFELDMNDPEDKKRLEKIEEEITELTNDFSQRVDVYEEINIIDSTGKTVLTIPPIFYNTKPLPPEHDELVDINVKMSGHDVPKYRDEAFIKMMNAWNEHQATDENLKDILAARKKFKQYKNEFNKIYQINSDENKASEEANLIDTFDEDEWSDEY